MADGSDLNTFWLNVTNIALGVATLLCCVAVGSKVVQDIFQHLRKRKTRNVQTDDLRRFVTHLGITMADGGKPIDKTLDRSSRKGLVGTVQSKQKPRSKK